MGVREDILQAGFTLLKEKGVAGLTQTQVARTAGYKQSHLTYYFPTRNELLLAIAEYTVDSILATLCARLSEKPDRRSLATALVVNVIEGLPPRVMMGLIVAADSDPGIRKALSRLIDHVRDKIRVLLERAGLAHGDEEVLLFHASIVGLAVLHQARLTELSEREIETGVYALVERLSMSASADGGDNHDRY